MLYPVEKKPTTQKNVAINTSVLEEFTEFCNKRGLSEARVVTALMLHFVRTTAEDREAITERLHEQLKATGGDMTADVGRTGGTPAKRAAKNVK